MRPEKVISKHPKQSDRCLRGGSLLSFKPDIPPKVISGVQKVTSLGKREKHGSAFSYDSKTLNKHKLCSNAVIKITSSTIQKLENVRNAPNLLSRLTYVGETQEACSS